MASGYVFIKGCPSCELFRLTLLFFRLLAQLSFAFPFFFCPLLPLLCLFELPE
jgi:hypothetical protein